MSKKLSAVAFFFLVALICLFGCSRNEYREYKQTKLALGTYVSITCVSNQGFETNVIIDSAFSLVDQLEALLSRYQKKSQVYQFNQIQAGLFSLNPETYDVFFQALHIARISEGAFDPTILPLIRLWKESAKENNFPSREKISSVLARVGYQQLLLEEKAVEKLKNGVIVDFGGIAKGYIVDRLAQFLKNKKDIDRVIVDAGGDIYCYGRNIYDEPWHVGIQHPLKKNKMLGVLLLQDRAVATSGNYERFYRIGGKQYSHIINPKNGMPVDEIVSVTIIAPTCVMADGLATAVTVLGQKKGMELIERLDDVEGMIVGKQEKSKMEISQSSGFSKYVINES